MRGPSISLMVKVKGESKLKVIITIISFPCDGEKICGLPLRFTRTVN
jgi:hypothetical protein